jgi:LysM repeat protein
MRGALHLSNGAIAQSGETIVAVTDNNGSIMFWSAPRPVDLAEYELADAIASVLNSSLNTSIVFGDICETLIHIVDAEENLFRIAIRYNTTVDSIQRSNNLHDTTIYPGQELTVPCNPAQIVGVNPSCGDSVVHTVLTGENLYRIGLSYGVSVVAIKSANSLASDMIVVGDQLRIPCANGSDSSPTTTQSQTTSQFSWTIPQQAPCFNVAASFPAGDLPGVTSGFVTASC